MSTTVTEASDRRATGAGRLSRIRRVVVAALVPLVLIGNSLLILLIPWHADIQYAIPGFPEPPVGLAEGERSDLARDGIFSIWPLGPGDRVLEEARLENGRQAFAADEIAHMADVRGVVRASLVLWLVAAVALILLLRKYGPARSRAALRAGAWLTLGIFAFVGLASVLSFDSLFTSFHELLFEDGTWTFPTDSTLIGLYPERFWITATGALVLLSALQALALILVVERPGRSRMPGWSRTEGRTGKR